MWKPIFESYFLNSDGQVKEVINGADVILPQFVTKGFRCVRLKKGDKPIIYRVHRLVAEFFVNNPENGTLVLFRDENKSNVTASNLLWSSRKMLRLKTHEGESNPRSKLNSTQVIEIKHLLKSGSKTHEDIAEMYGVSRSLITHIKTGRVWSHMK